MAYQIFIRFNDNKETILTVATSNEDFNKTTIKEIKEKFKLENPGAPEPDKLRVTFGTKQLEDEKTLGFYKITHASTLIFVMRMDGGGAAVLGPLPLSLPVFQWPIKPEDGDKGITSVDHCGDHLCDIKQRPESNISDTHTAGFSQPKPSGLDIHPLLNCQSCVHIADSDQWLQIEPSACTDEGGSKFRVSTDPGRYECVRTRMRWVCDCVVTLQYRTVDGLFLNAELERLQCNRIGPVIDVTVISGKLEEVHLPHYACLGESDPSLKDAVKVLTVKDEGITTEPVQLTRFHAKIVQPSFSLKTLIISWIMGWYEHCDLLLYMCSKDPRILHLYLFPFDECAKEKVEKKEKSNYPIQHPRPGRPIRMNTPHILKVPGASTIDPKEGITLTRETPPNYFKIKTRLENDLRMTLIREEDKEVWTTMIEKDELDLIRPKKDKPCMNSEEEANQQRNMLSLEELLLESLMDLGEYGLKRFQWYLRKHEGIPKSEMEKADVLKTVDTMVARSGPEEAVKITVKILRKMKQNNLAKQLENKHKQAQTEGNMKASSTC